jgi:hypothetical protein
MGAGMGGVPLLRQMTAATKSGSQPLQPHVFLL